MLHIGMNRTWNLNTGASADGGARCDALLKSRGSELKKAASGLLSLYLERKEQALTARIGAFVRCDALTGF